MDDENQNIKSSINEDPRDAVSESTDSAVNIEHQNTMQLIMHATNPNPQPAQFKKSSSFVAPEASSQRAGRESQQLIAQTSRETLTTQRTSHHLKGPSSKDALLDEHKRQVSGNLDQLDKLETDGSILRQVELDSDSDSIDDDALRSVDPFSSSDSDNEVDVQVLKQSISQHSQYIKKGTLSKQLKNLGSVLSHQLSADAKSVHTDALSKMSKVKKIDIKLMEQPDQPVKGIVLYIFYTLAYSANFVFAQFLYNRNEPDPDANPPRLELTPFQMLFARSFFALIVQVCYVNTELKKAVYDDLKFKRDGGVLSFRSIQGSVTNIINFLNTKYIAMTIIAVVNNMSPLIAIVLAFLILKEKLKCYGVLMICLTLVGVLIVVLFEEDDDTTSLFPNNTTKIIVYTGLLINPFLTAGGTIVMRKMKKFHEAVVSFYLNGSLLIVNLTIMLVMFGPSNAFAIYNQFTWVDWLLSVCTGIFAVMSQTLRFKALKLQKASVVSQFQPLTTLEQFTADLLIFKEEFTPVQIGGILYLFCVYIFQGLKFFCYDAPKEKKRTEAKKSVVKSVIEAQLLSIDTVVDDKDMSLEIVPEEVSDSGSIAKHESSEKSPTNTSVMPPQSSFKTDSSMANFSKQDTSKYWH